MAPQSENEVNSRLISYLSGEITLPAFREWFDKETWETESADPSLQRLLGEIELRLAEFTNGHWTEGELKSKLKPLAIAPVR